MLDESWMNLGKYEASDTTFWKATTCLKALLDGLICNLLGFF